MTAAGAYGAVMKYFTKCVALLVLLASPVLAKPVTYAVVPDQSGISFTYTFGKDAITGSFPDFDAQVSIDFDAVRNSTVSAQIQTGSAKGGFPFASQALASARMLDAKAFPQISFTSEQVTGFGNAVDLTGMITIKDVTRPITLGAQLFKDDRTSADARDNIIIVINGSLNRHDFGVSGWPDEVGPMLEIEITARLMQLR